MTPARPVQTGLFLAGLALAAGLDHALAPGIAGQVVILAPAVALLGLPHGALDLPMAEALWPLRRPADRVRFHAAYLGLAGGVALLWWLAPAAALAAFLAYSALHFAGDWEGDGRLAQAAGGISAIGAPALFHTGEVAAIFALLGPGEAAAPLARALAAAGGAGAGLAALSLVAAPRRGRHAGAEQAGIWLGAALLPPLLYFVAYFCLLHALRHFAQTLAELPDPARARRAAGAVTAVSILGAAGAFAALHLSGGLAVQAASLQVVFIGLAALTVPHMLLVDRFRRQTPAEAVRAG